MPKRCKGKTEINSKEIIRHFSLFFLLSAPLRRRLVCPTVHLDTSVPVMLSRMQLIATEVIRWIFEGNLDTIVSITVSRVTPLINKPITYEPTNETLTDDALRSSEVR